jgi:hypothetical protein
MRMRIVRRSRKQKRVRRKRKSKRRMQRQMQRDGRIQRITIPAEPETIRSIFVDVRASPGVPGCRALRDPSVACGARRPFAPARTILALFAGSGRAFHSPATKISL